MMVEVRDVTEESYKRHGGPYDRGAADAWYGRPYNPHYFKGDTYGSEIVHIEQMSMAEKLAYHRGYESTPFAQKEWD
jgi:hypothetical protein